MSRSDALGARPAGGGDPIPAGGGDPNPREMPMGGVGPPRGAPGSGTPTAGPSPRASWVALLGSPVAHSCGFPLKLLLRC